MTRYRKLVRAVWLGIVATIVALVSAAPATACTVSSLGAELGTYSPSAVKARAVPKIKTRAGLQCSFALLNLVGSDYVRATFNSANSFKLIRTGGGSVAYKASADEADTYVVTQGATIDYTQNNLLNVLGLLENSNADLPIFIKADEAVFPPNRRVQG